MNLQKKLNEIRELLSEYVLNIKGQTAMGHGDLNLLAEPFLLELLPTILDLPDLKNLNSERKYFPGLDLGDDSKHHAFQISATPSLTKVKKTLRAVLEHGLQERFRKIQLYVLTEKQSSYSQHSIDRVTKGAISFDVECDVLDFTDLLRLCGELPLERLDRVLNVLRKHLRNVPEPLLQVRYVICREADVAVALLKGDTSLSPFEGTLLCDNAQGRFIEMALKNGRSVRVSCRIYESIDEYMSRHPEGHISTEIDEEYPFYSCVRSCENEELLRNVFPKDPFSDFLYRFADKATELTRAVAYNHGCGDGRLEETYLTRPAWCVFLAITVIGSRPVTLKSIQGLADSGPNIRQLEEGGIQVEQRLPGAALAPGETVLVPLGLALGPLSDAHSESTYIKGISAVGECRTELHLSDLEKSFRHDGRVVGPFFTPNAINLSTDGVPSSIGVHALELDNVYTIDKVWYCGSCPRIFSVSKQGSVSYLGELLERGFMRTVTDTVVVPDDCEILLIAELEDEITHLDSIAVDGTQVYAGVELAKGQALEIPTLGASMLSVVGSYHPTMQVSESTSHSIKNRLISRFLADWH